MVTINARAVAADALMEILEEGSYNTAALKKLLKKNGALPKRDKAFVTEMVNGVLRNITYLDYQINAVASLQVDKMKPYLRTVLRLSIYQAYFMRVPASACCNEAVKLVKARGYGSLAGFCNGVIRGSIRKKGQISLPPSGTAEYLSVRYSHPIWIVRMWLSQYAYPFVEKLCSANNQPAEVTIAVNEQRITPEKLKQRLQEEGISVQAGRHLSYALRVSGLSDITVLSSYQEGLFHVQDESSMLAVETLAPKQGERILDMCAAPGGKCFLMAEKMENIGEVIARDIYEHKLSLLSEGAERLGLDSIKPELWDARQFKEEEKASYDRVLVDAPCSGLGLVRKKPDIRWKKDGSTIDSLVPVQREILSLAAEYVKPGGILVYSTCTICKKENEGNVKWFTESHPFSLLDARQYLPETVATMEETQRTVALFPHLQGTDGFFIARMQRKE